MSQIIVRLREGPGPSYRLRIHVDEDTYAVLETAAQAYGLSLASWAHDVLVPTASHHALGADERGAVEQAARQDGEAPSTWARKVLREAAGVDPVEGPRSEAAQALNRARWGREISE